MVDVLHRVDSSYNFSNRGRQGGDRRNEEIVKKRRPAVYIIIDKFEDSGSSCAAILIIAEGWKKEKIRLHRHDTRTARRIVREFPRAVLELLVALGFHP